MLVRRETSVLRAYPYAQFRVRMLNLGYEIALPVGVNLHPQGEHALSVAVAALRAALSVATATLRAALSVGVNLLLRGEHALSVAVAMLRAALPVDVKIKKFKSHKSL